MLDLTGLADKSREDVARLWRDARSAGDKAAEYIIRDHWTQAHGGSVEDAAAELDKPAPVVEHDVPKAKKDDE